MDQLQIDQIKITDYDSIRAAVAVNSERTKLLRRLLRLATRLHVNLTTADQLPRREAKGESR